MHRVFALTTASALLAVVLSVHVELPVGHPQAPYDTPPEAARAEGSPLPSTGAETSTAEPYSSCGGEVVAHGGVVGVLVSPGYPHQYEAGLDCVWTIKAPEGMRLNLRFTSFEVTATAECEEDYVTLHLGDEGETTSLGAESPRLCGGLGDVGPSYSSHGDVVTMILHTAEGGETCKGFRLTYDVEEVAVSCGAVVTLPQFVFRHTEAPLPVSNTSAECRLTIRHECAKPVCQLRLEFDQLTLQPPLLGECREDRLMLQGHPSLPPLCGENTGQHVLIDVSGRTSTDLLVVTSPLLPMPVGHVHDDATGENSVASWQYEVEDNRGWSIRVVQVPCDCETVTDETERAPDGCLQYYTGITGTITGFNFQGKKRDLGPCWNGTEEDCGKEVWTGHLNHLHHHVCIAQRDGYCGILYQPTGPDAFMMTGDVGPAGGMEGRNLFGSEQCQSDYLLLPKGRTPGDNDPWPHDRFCGLTLGNYVPGPVVSYSPPFSVLVHTDKDEFSHGPDTQNRGYQLHYTQLPCNAPFLFNGDQKFIG